MYKQQGTLRRYKWPRCGGSSHFPDHIPPHVSTPVELNDLLYRTAMEY